VGELCGRGGEERGRVCCVFCGGEGEFGWLLGGSKACEYGAGGLGG